MQHFPSGEFCRCSSAVCWPSQHISGFVSLVCVSASERASVSVLSVIAASSPFLSVQMYPGLLETHRCRSVLPPCILPLTLVRLLLLTMSAATRGGRSDARDEPGEDHEPGREPRGLAGVRRGHAR